MPSEKMKPDQPSHDGNTAAFSQAAIIIARRKALIETLDGQMARLDEHLAELTRLSADMERLQKEIDLFLAVGRKRRAIASAASCELHAVATDLALDR